MTSNDNYLFPVGWFLRTRPMLVRRTRPHQTPPPDREGQKRVKRGLEEGGRGLGVRRGWERVRRGWERVRSGLEEG